MLVLYQIWRNVVNNWNLWKADQNVAPLIYPVLHYKNIILIIYLYSNLNKCNKFDLQFDLRFEKALGTCSGDQDPCSLHNLTMFFLNSSNSLTSVLPLFRSCIVSALCKAMCSTLLGVQVHVDALCPYVLMLEPDCTNSPLTNHLFSTLHFDVPHPLIFLTTAF